MPDKNVQLPDGSIVAFPDSMADADISAAIQKHLAPQPTANTNMALAMSGQQKQMTPENQEQFESGKKAGIKSGIETTGFMLGGEAVPALRGVVGGLARILGSGSGAAIGNAAGQVGTTGTIDPSETLQSGAVGAGLQVFGEGLPMLRSSLSRLSYTGELAADGTPKLTRLARSILHPTEMPETIFRAAVPPTPEVQKAMFEQAGEANASKLEEQMNAVESARQKELAQWERLRNLDAQSRMTRGTQQARLDTAAAKAAPPPSPFGNAISTSPVSISSLGRAELPPAGGLPQGNPTPFVSKFTPPAAPEPSRIVSPNSPPPHVEGSYWSFKEPALRQAVFGGDREAAIVYKQRFGTLPPGASFLTDVGANPNRGLYQSEK